MGTLQAHVVVIVEIDPASQQVKDFYLSGDEYMPTSEFYDPEEGQWLGTEDVVCLDGDGEEDDDIGLTTYGNALDYVARAPQWLVVLQSMAAGGMGADQMVAMAREALGHNEPAEG